MSDSRPMPDSERLPWLGPLPDRSATPGSRTALRALTIIIVLLALALAATLSLLILRRSDTPDAPAPTPSSAAKVALPVAPAPTPAPIPALPPATRAPAPVLNLTETPPPRAKTRSALKKALVEKTPVSKARSRLRQEAPRRAAQPAVRVRRGAEIRNWPAVAWVGTPGTVIQLGAYSSPRQADIAWRSSVRAYPYLATLPRVVTTVRVGPERIRYYRLRLGTPSPVHASQTCRNLRSIRRSCMVT